MTRKIWTICAVVFLQGIPVVSFAASFNCAKATADNELMICADRQLSTMDDRLAVLFRAAKAVAPDAVAFKKETNHEWRKRQQCVDRDCLVAWYQRRISQLETIINLSQIKNEPAKPVSPPLPVETTPAPHDSMGLAGILGLMGGLLFIAWIIKRLAGADRSRASTTTSAAKGGPVVTGDAQAAPGITEDIGWGGSAKRLPPSKRSGREVPTVWIRAGQPVEIAALNIPGGMLYVGSTLTAPDGSVEPAQIDPALDVDLQAATPEECLFGYWPRYDAISPQARRAYLTWLAGGRLDPSADVGYVFLFFYGLERRVLVDAKTDAAARAEVPAIMAEIERLRAIYNNRSFQSYTASFLEYVAAAGAFEKALYSREPPIATGSRGMPLLLRIALGQCALDGTPVPGAWALMWARSEPNVSLPRVAERCQTLFDEQFKRIYGQRFADGLKLNVNRTKLKVSYRPASAGLLSQTFTSEFGGLPDVTTVVTPLKKLQGVVDEVAEGLAAYSRFISRHADRADSIEATLLLPKELWSSTIKAAVSALGARVGEGMLVVRLGEVLSAFGGTSAPTRETLKTLFRVLRLQGIGVEPDVLSGAKMSKANDSVVLFRVALNEGEMTGTILSAYAAVAIMLDFGLALANADGEISDREVQFLNRQVDTWSHVGESAQRRLRARLRLGTLYPPSLASMRSRIEPLPRAARTALAKLLAALAMADGKLDPVEVKHLEKVYALLGVDSKTLYTELHGVAAVADQSAAPTGMRSTRALIANPDAQARPRSNASSAIATSGGVRLDPARIAALQAESEQVTALLSKVFEEEAPTAPALMVGVEDAHPEEPSEEARRLLGLDGEHSAFVRVLLTRHSWSRAELNDIAADMEMMLDGALERVNEAALERYDVRLAEGDDPIEIAQDLMESVGA